MGRLNVVKCPTEKRGSNASHFATSSKKAKGPPPILLPPSFVLSTGNRRIEKGVVFDTTMEQLVGKKLYAYSFEYLERAPTLYEDFLTSGLRQHIEMGKGMDLYHTLLRHTLMSASLAYKDVFETEKNEAERRELRDELVKARSELAARAGREKQLAAEVQESQILRKALQLEVKDSTTKINELQARLERAKS
ncbi:hypothetical protein ACOSP7_013328 [Xanthoceras sorbifolium]